VAADVRQGARRDEPVSRSFRRIELGSGILDGCPGINSFLEKGGCDSAHSEEQPNAEQAVRTGLAFGALLARCRKALSAQHSPAAPSLSWSADAVGAGVDLVVGRHDVGLALVALCESAVSTWDCLRTDPVPAMGEAGLGPEGRLLRRGVAVRIMYTDGPGLAAGQWQFLRQVEALAGDVRLTWLVPTDLIITDGELTVLPLDPDRPAAGLVVIRSRPWARAARGLFEDCWRRFTPGHLAAQPLSSPR
jgi:hypothetical protein